MKKTLFVLILSAQSVYSQLIVDIKSGNMCEQTTYDRIYAGISKLTVPNDLYNILSEEERKYALTLDDRYNLVMAIKSKCSANGKEAKSSYE